MTHLTKRNVFWVSSGYILFLSLFIFYAWIASCPRGHLCNETLIEFLSNFVIFLSPLLLVFLFSLITYKMRDEVFEHWRNFSLWALPFLILFVYLLSESSHGGHGIEGVIRIWVNGIFVYVLILIYAFASIVLILKKRTDLKWGKKKSQI